MYIKVMHNQWIDIKIDFPEEWQCNSREVSMPLYENFHNAIFTQKSVKVIPAEITKNRYDIPVTISSKGRLSEMHTKIVLFTE